jgi:hypothetical protein
MKRPKSPEPTAAGACRSAVAVRVTGLRSATEIQRESPSLDFTL